MNPREVFILKAEGETQKVVSSLAASFKNGSVMQASLNFQTMKTFEQIEQKIAELQARKYDLIKDYRAAEDEHAKDISAMENMSLDFQINLLKWVIG